MSAELKQANTGRAVDLLYLMLVIFGFLLVLSALPAGATVALGYYLVSRSVVNSVILCPVAALVVVAAGLTLWWAARVRISDRRRDRAVSSSTVATPVATPKFIACDTSLLPG